MTVQDNRRINLERLITEVGSAAALARLTDTDPAYLSQIRTKVRTPRGTVRNIGENLARRLEEGTNKPYGWMDLAHDTPDDKSPPWSNVGPGPDLQYLPLISWVQAGEWTEISDHQPGDYEQLVPVTRRYSDRAFALKIAGDSMQAPDRDSFPEGAIIAVEPLQEARNGSYVVARNGHSEEATFKQLVIDGNRRYLKPLNPRYPIIEITEEITICGVVRQLVMDFDK